MMVGGVPGVEGETKGDQTSQESRTSKHQLSRTVSKYPKLTLPGIQTARVLQNPIPNPLNYSLSP